ncbi:MAG: hypothetical protein GY853_06725 [PVC group bacterium]|nr:hypothetical protein [PVC group bacterium]
MVRILDNLRYAVENSEGQLMCKVQTSLIEDTIDVIERLRKEMSSPRQISEVRNLPRHDPAYGEICCGEYMPERADGEYLKREDVMKILS